MEDDLVEREGEGKAMLCVTNCKPFFLVHAELQGMNLMCLYPFHPQKLQFPPYHKYSVCAAAFVTFFIILSVLVFFFFYYLIPDTSLAQSLPSHFHLTLHFSERRCTSVLGIVLFVSISPASYCVYSVSFPACGWAR